MNATDTKTIIIVDDEVNIVHLLVDILESADYNAIGCSVWTEAMDAISRDNPDLVLLDLKMPTIDGPSMLEFIRGEGLDVPVIVVSGFVTDQVAEDLSKLGVSAFVGKPFRAAEILKQVKIVLEESKSAPPASMSALYEHKEEAEEPATRTDPPAEANQVLEALQKLDGDSPTPPPSSPPQSETPDNEVLAALQRNDTTAPPPPPVAAPAPTPPKPSTPPPPSAPKPQVPSAPPTPPATASPDPSFSNELLGGDSDRNGASEDADGGSSVSVTGHRRHHRPPPRKKRFTKRNFFLFGSMFIICVAVAGFMAAMNWYASQIDLEEIQKNTQKAITKQATNEILQKLQERRP
jgi:two-component system, response regulator, stage 0 sporulation protein F